MEETTQPTLDPVVLALYLSSRGIGVAVFEGVLAPVDYCIVRTEGTERVEQLVERARTMFDRYKPDIVVLQDCATVSGRFSPRIQEAVRHIATLARRKRKEVHQYSRAAVRACFAYYGASTKREIAREIAKQLPEFARRIPPMRRIWEGEHYQMKLFDAVALAFTYYSEIGGFTKRE